MRELCIKSSEVLADLRSAGWLEQELHPELDRHRRHQMADICESGNIDRVWRVLGVAVAQLRMALSDILEKEKEAASANDLMQAEEWRFRWRFPLPEPVHSLLREKIHEYLVGAVMVDRTEVIIPQASTIWSERASSALSQIRSVMMSARSRHVSVRRPMWPM